MDTSALALRLTVLLSLALTAFLALNTTSAFAAGFTRQLPASGTTSLAGAGFAAAAGIQGPEFGAVPPAITDPSLSARARKGAAASGAKKAKSNPELNLSFDGLSHFDQRTANGGNQFAVEPAQPGLCAGNGYVLDTVQSALRVYDASGNPSRVRSI
jgi:hypothetical protein